MIKKNKTNNKVMVSITLDKKEYHKIKKEAEKEDRSMSSILRKYTLDRINNN